MTEVDLVAASDANYYESWRLLASGEGAFVHEGDSILITAPSRSLAWLNVVFVTKPLVDPEGQLAAAFARMHERTLPFFVHLREGLDEASERACERLGLRAHDAVPGMALAPIAASRRDAQLDIREARDGGSFADLASVLSASFDIPAGESRSMIEGARARPNARWWAGYSDGRPVACSCLLVIDGVAGINAIGTLADYRGRGYGEAMTWQAVNAGVEAGCRVAVLQASEMGRPVYERMGFGAVASYKTYVRM